MASQTITACQSFPASPSECVCATANMEASVAAHFCQSNLRLHDVYLHSYKREQFPKEWSLDVKGSRRGPSVSSAGGGGNGGRELADDVADEKIRGGGPPNVVHRLSPQKSGHALLGRPSSRVEVLDAVDLTAPKGFLWQPMSVGRLDCSKTHEFCETTVYYCLMKIGEYQENPWKFPMATMLQRHSGCGNPGSGRAYLLSTLRVSGREKVLMCRANGRAGMRRSIPVGVPAPP